MESGDGSHRPVEISQDSQNEEQDGEVLNIHYERFCAESHRLFTTGLDNVESLQVFESTHRMAQRFASEKEDLRLILDVRAWASDSIFNLVLSVLAFLIYFFRVKCDQMSLSPKR
jgi:hypothetical protein